MKFLKTFLFTISLTFLSFGIVTLKGFCASVALDPALSLSVNSNINQFSSFAITPEYLSIYGPAYIDELNSQLYQNYGWDLETLSWYGEDRFKGYMFGQETNPLNSTDLTPQIANAISNRMLSGTLETIVTAKSLYDTGYNYFSTAIPQWGANAKQWILGKVDSVTGKISEVGSNVVTKITSQGLSNYLSIYNNMVSSGDVIDVNSFQSLNTSAIKFYCTRSSVLGDYTVIYCSLDFTDPVIFYSGAFENGYIPMCVLVPSSYGYIDSSNNFVLSSKIVSCNYTLANGSNSTTRDVSIFQPSTILINNVSYTYGKILLSPGYLPGTNKAYGNLDSAKSLVDDNGSIALSYDYSSTWLSALQDQLDRLIGKYVDSISLKRIQDIIDSIPIGVENVDDVDVPVAIPDQSIIDELTDAVDDAVALDSDYAAVFEDSYSEESNPPVPDPEPSNQGTYVPEDFPATIFSPINDSVGGVFDFVSIFEPLFYIFSFSAGLLGLWLVIPFVILFMFLFKLLK